MSEKALELREKMRRSMLREFAPIMTLNDWADSDLKPGDRQVSIEPLPDMNPSTARGIIAIRSRGIPHETVLTFVWDYGRIRATAKLDEPIFI